MVNPNPVYKGMLPKQGSIVMGIVTAFNRTQYTADVFVLPQMWKLENVRQATAFVGTGMNIVSDLAVNDVVVIALINDSIDDPIIIGRVWHYGMTVPTYSENESVITHKSGTTIKIADDGDVTITPVTGKKVYLGAASGAKAVVLDGDTVAGHAHQVTGVQSGVSSVTTSLATSTVVASSSKAAAT